MYGGELIFHGLKACGKARCERLLQFLLDRRAHRFKRTGVGVVKRSRLASCFFLKGAHGPGHCREPLVLGAREALKGLPQFRLQTSVTLSGKGLASCEGIGQKLCRAVLGVIHALAGRKHITSHAVNLHGKPCRRLVRAALKRGDKSLFKGFAPALFPRLPRENKARKDNDEHQQRRKNPDEKNRIGV